MLKPNKAKNPNQVRIGDFTPGQLVVAICAFLCAALICFALGVIVGKFDERNSSREKGRLATHTTPQQPNQPRLPLAASNVPPVKLPGQKRPFQTPPAQNPPAQKPDDSSAKAAPGPGQGVQTSPRPIIVPPAPGKPGYPESPGPGTTGSVQAGPRVSEHPAPPKPPSKDGEAAAPAPPAEENKAAPEATANAAASAPPNPNAQPAPEADKSPSTTPPDAVKPPAAEPPKTEPPKTEVAKAGPKGEPLALEPVAPTGTAAPVQDAATAPPAAEAPAAAGAVPDGAQADAKKGLYTVQLAALSSPTRKEQGLAMKKKLEADGLQPELLISKDGARVSVVVGSYPDRRAAQDACNDLRTNKGYSGCFVRTR